jgi:hypothetical protein
LYTYGSDLKNIKRKKKMQPISLLLLLLAALVAVASATSLPASASIPNVPYFRQDETFSCGAAAFQSLLFNAGRYVKNQREIVDVLRSSPLGGTIASDISRGTFFSNLSSAQGTVYPAAERATAGWKNYTGGVPGLGLVSYELQPGTCDINAVKQLIAGGNPVLAMVRAPALLCVRADNCVHC